MLDTTTRCDTAATPETTAEPPPARPREQHPDQAILTAIARGRLPSADALDRSGAPCWRIQSLCEHWRIPLGDFLAALPTPDPDARQHGESAFTVHR